MVDFPALGNPCEEDREALLVPGGMSPAQRLDHLREREPLGDLASAGEPRAQIAGGDADGPRPDHHLAIRRVAVFVGEIHELAHRHARDPQLLFVPPHQLLSVVRTVERLARGAATRTRVVGAHDRVGTAVVLLNEREQQRFLRSRQPHRVRQERERHRIVRIVGQDRLAGADPRVVIDVTGLSEPYDGVDQELGVALSRRAECDLVIDAVGGGVTRSMGSRAVAPGGIFVHIGLMDSKEGLEIRKITLQEVSLAGIYTYTRQDFRATVDALASGMFGSLEWVETRPLADGAHAFDDLDKGRIRAAKLVLVP